MQTAVQTAVFLALLTHTNSENAFALLQPKLPPYWGQLEVKDGAYVINFSLKNNPLFFFVSSARTRAVATRISLG